MCGVGAERGVGKRACGFAGLGAVGTKGSGGAFEEDAEELKVDGAEGVDVAF